MFINAQLSTLRARWGRPYHVWMSQEFDEKGWFQVEKSTAQGRSQDVTLFIRDAGGRFAILNKHSYPPGVFHSPSGSVHLGESFEASVLREIKEETDLEVDLQRFILHLTLDITHNGELAHWESLCFSAETRDERPGDVDPRATRNTRWFIQRQLEEMCLKLRETGVGGLIYRARLTETYLWALEHPLTIREANKKDLIKIEISSAGKDPRVGKVLDHHWWAAEVHGLYGGAVGVKIRPDGLELIGLNVHPMFRGRGIGHAILETAIDRLQEEAFLDSLGPEVSQIAKGGVWVAADSEGYFLPSGFKLARPGQIPPSLQKDMKNLGLERMSVLRHSIG